MENTVTSSKNNEVLSSSDDESSNSKEDATINNNNKNNNNNNNNKTDNATAIGDDTIKTNRVKRQLTSNNTNNANNASVGGGGGRHKRKLKEMLADNNEEGVEGEENKSNNKEEKHVDEGGDDNNNSRKPVKRRRTGYENTNVATTTTSSPSAANRANMNNPNGNTTNGSNSNNNNNCNGGGKVNKKKKSRKRKNSNITKRPSEEKRQKFDGISLDELECVVCKEFPSSHIYQCSNGHFLCRTCHKQVRESKNSICPICRVRISRRTPPRNRLAEKYLASLEMQCSNDQCNAKIQYAYLKQHVEQECPYRTVTCKFEPLGCDWKGLEKDRKKHKRLCKTRNLTPYELLKQVKAKNAREDKERENLKQLDNRYIEIGKIWESRCRNIVSRDVIVESGQVFDAEGVIHSRPFHALHYCWIVEIKQVKEKNENKNNNSNSETVRLKVRLALDSHSKLRHRMLLHVCILRGPDTTQGVHPISFECEFSRKDIHSQWVDVTANDSINSLIESMSSSEVNLRVVLVDKRRGEVSHSFRADDDRGTSESSFEVGDDYSDARSIYSEASCTGSESLTEHSNEYSEFDDFDI